MNMTSVRRFEWPFWLMITGAFLFFTRTLEQRPDALGTLITIKLEHGFFHPHHLLFAPILYSLCQMVTPLWPTPDSLVITQFHNIGWTLVLLSSFYLLAKKVILSPLKAFALTQCLLFTEGIWVYATQAESYIPSISLLCFITALIFTCPHWTKTKLGSIVITCLFSLSVLYHQAFSLFFLPLSYILYVQRGWRFFKIIVASGFLAVLIYIIVYASTTTEELGITGFFIYVFKYATLPNPGWGTWENISIDGWVRLMNSQIHTVVPITDLPWFLRKIILTLFTGFLLALAIWHMRQIMYNAPLKSWRSFFLIWQITFLSFFWWWTPSEHEFLIATQLPIALLVLLFFSDIKHKWPFSKVTNIAIIGVFAIVIGSVNYSVEVHALTNSKGQDFHEAELLIAQTPFPTVILTQYPVSQNITYYTHQRAIPINLLLLYFYAQQPIPTHFLISSQEHIFIEKKALSPHYTLRTFNGQSHPLEWQTYIKWLFQFEESQGQSTARTWEQVTLSNGEVYLHIQPDKQLLKDKTALLNQVNTLMQP